MIRIEFGIDCDPFFRRQENFQEEAEKILGRPIQTVSKFFGCWEWKEEVSVEQHEQIAKTLIWYYNNGLCRGVSCTDIRKFL